MKPLDFGILVLVAGYLIFAVRSAFGKKGGCSGCCAGCTGCAGKKP